MNNNDNAKHSAGILVHHHISWHQNLIEPTFLKHFFSSFDLISLESYAAVSHQLGKRPVSFLVWSSPTIQLYFTDSNLTWSWCRQSNRFVLAQSNPRFRLLKAGYCTSPQRNWVSLQTNLQSLPAGYGWRSASPPLRSTAAAGLWGQSDHCCPSSSGCEAECSGCRITLAGWPGWCSVCIWGSAIKLEWQKINQM